MEVRTLRRAGVASKVSLSLDVFLHLSFPAIRSAGAKVVEETFSPTDSPISEEASSPVGDE